MEKRDWEELKEWISQQSSQNEHVWKLVAGRLDHIKRAHHTVADLTGWTFVFPILVAFLLFGVYSWFGVIGAMKILGWMMNPIFGGFVFGFAAGLFVANTIFSDPANPL